MALAPTPDPVVVAASALTPTVGDSSDSGPDSVSLAIRRWATWNGLCRSLPTSDPKGTGYRVSQCVSPAPSSNGWQHLGVKVLPARKISILNRPFGHGAYEIHGPLAYELAHEKSGIACLSPLPQHCFYLKDRNSGYYIFLKLTDNYKQILGVTKRRLRSHKPRVHVTKVAACLMT